MTKSYTPNEQASTVSIDAGWGDSGDCLSASNSRVIWCGA